MASLTSSQRAAERAFGPLESTGVFGEPSAPLHRGSRVHGIILAGVHAWGGCPLEQTVPRPLLPIADKPLISHMLNWFGAGGIARATICANSDTHVLHQALGKRPHGSVAVDYFEDVMPRGPAGCTRDAAMAAGNSATEYVVAEGTILPHLDLESLVESHRDSGAALTVVVGDNGEASGSCNGILEPVGIYVFSASAVKHVPENGYQDIKERLIPQLYKAGEKIVPFGVRRDRVPRVTNPATYLLLNQREIERLASGHRTPSDYHRRQEAWIHSSAQVAASARFVGPVMVGPGTVIEDDVVVVGPTSIGSGCHIGARSVVSRSTLWRGAAIGPAAQLDRCIVADDAEVETATVARDMLLVNVTSASLGLVARLFSRRFNGRSGARRITYAVSLEV